MEDRALLPGDEDVPGGEAGIRLRPEHHIRALPRRLLRADRDEAARAQGLRRQAAHRAALRFHPRVQRHRDARRRLRQQRDRHADLPGRKGKAWAGQTGQRIPVEKGSGQPVQDGVLTPQNGGESQIQVLHLSQRKEYLPIK